MEDSYQVESQINFKNDNGKEQTNICPVDNIARWRFAEDLKKGDGGKSTINSVMSKGPAESGDALANGMLVNDIDPTSISRQGIESNSRMVEWSDGSYSLIIGDEVFDIRQEDLPESGIFLKYDTELAVLKDTIDSKIFVKPTGRSTRHVQQFMMK